MKSSRILVALVATAACAFAGSAGAGHTGVGPGGGTVNGLLPTTFQPNMVPIAAWMASSISPTPQLLANAYTQSQGHKLLQDTIDCALPRGARWEAPTGHTPGGGPLLLSHGLMTNAGWPGTAVAGCASASPLVCTPVREQIQDALTCMITRLNFFGVDVPIFVSGPHVAHKSTGSGGPEFDPNGPQNDPSQYPYREAAWVASVGDPNRIELDVWPEESLLKNCAASPGQIRDLINLRVCGSIGGCGVQVHPMSPASPGSHCTGRDGEWSCPTAQGPSQPAISTRLGLCAWRLLYMKTGQFGAPPCNPPDGFTEKQLEQMCDSNGNGTGAAPTHS